MDTRVKVIAEVRLTEEASAEELDAIRRLLVRAGLIVVVKNRDLIIKSEIRNDKASAL